MILRTTSVALMLVLLTLGSHIASGQSVGRQRTAAAPNVTVGVPDSMKVSVQGTVPVNVRIGEALTIGKMPAEPVLKSILPSLSGAFVTILAVIVAQKLKDRADRKRTTARLVTRIRGALENAALTLKTVVRKKGNGTREIDPQTMGGIVKEWQRYDRVSDDIALLNNRQIEEEIDNVLAAARQVAEAALEDERRFHDEVREVGERIDGKLILSPTVIESIHAQRRERIKQMAYMRDAAQSLLNRFDARWKPEPWHRQRRVIEPVDEPAAPPQPKQDG